MKMPAFRFRAIAERQGRRVAALTTRLVILLLAHGVPFLQCTIGPALVARAVAVYVDLSGVRERGAPSPSVTTTADDRSLPSSTPPQSRSPDFSYQSQAPSVEAPTAAGERDDSDSESSSDPSGGEEEISEQNLVERTAVARARRPQVLKSLRTLVENYHEMNHMRPSELTDAVTCVVSFFEKLLKTDILEMCRATKTRSPEYRLTVEKYHLLRATLTRSEEHLNESLRWLASGRTRSKIESAVATQNQWLPCLQTGPQTGLGLSLLHPEFVEFRPPTAPGTSAVASSSTTASRAPLVAAPQNVPRLLQALSGMRSHRWMKPQRGVQKLATEDLPWLSGEIWDVIEKVAEGRGGPRIVWTNWRQPGCYPTAEQNPKDSRDSTVAASLPLQSPPLAGGASSSDQPYEQVLAPTREGVQANQVVVRPVALVPDRARTDATPRNSAEITDNGRAVSTTAKLLLLFDPVGAKRMVDHNPGMHASPNFSNWSAEEQYLRVSHLLSRQKTQDGWPTWTRFLSAKAWSNRGKQIVEARSKGGAEGSSPIFVSLERLIDRLWETYVLLAKCGAPANRMLLAVRWQHAVYRLLSHSHDFQGHELWEQTLAALRGAPISAQDAPSLHQRRMQLLYQDALLAALQKQEETALRGRDNFVRVDLALGFGRDANRGGSASAGTSAGSAAGGSAAAEQELGGGGLAANVGPLDEVLLGLSAVDSLRRLRHAGFILDIDVQSFLRLLRRPGSALNVDHDAPPAEHHPCALYREQLFRVMANEFQQPVVLRRVLADHVQPGRRGQSAAQDPDLLGDWSSSLVVPVVSLEAALFQDGSGNAARADLASQSGERCPLPTAPPTHPPLRGSLDAGCELSDASTEFTAGDLATPASGAGSSTFAGSWAGSPVAQSAPVAPPVPQPQALPLTGSNPGATMMNNRMGPPRCSPSLLSPVRISRAAFFSLLRLHLLITGPTGQLFDDKANFLTTTEHGFNILEEAFRPILQSPAVAVGGAAASGAGGAVDLHSGTRQARGVDVGQAVALYNDHMAAEAAASGYARADPRALPDLSSYLTETALRSLDIWCPLIDHLFALHVSIRHEVAYANQGKEADGFPLDRRRQQELFHFLTTQPLLYLMGNPHEFLQMTKVGQDLAANGIQPVDFANFFADVKLAALSNTLGGAATKSNRFRSAADGDAGASEYREATGAGPENVMKLLFSFQARGFLEEADVRFVRERVLSPPGGLLSVDHNTVTQFYRDNFRVSLGYRLGQVLRRKPALIPAGDLSHMMREQLAKAFCPSAALQTAFRMCAGGGAPALRALGFPDVEADLPDAGGSSAEGGGDTNIAHGGGGGGASASGGGPDTSESGRGPLLARRSPTVSPPIGSPTVPCLWDRTPGSNDDNPYTPSGRLPPAPFPGELVIPDSVEASTRPQNSRVDRQETIMPGARTPEYFSSYGTYW